MAYSRASLSFLFLLFIDLYTIKAQAYYPALPDSVIAHRGASALAPENTLAAFKKTKELGIKFIEFDVVVSPADSERTPFIFHDKTLDRTTNTKGDIAKYSYAEIKQFDAGAWFSKEFVGEKIPSLEDVAKFLLKNNMSANVEIKPIAGMEEITAEQAYRVINQYFPQPDARIIFSSFSIKSLKRLREICQYCHIAILIEKWRDDWKRIAKSLSAVSINLAYELVTKERVAMVKAENYKLCAYTVDDESQARKLYDIGVDAIFTNEPDKIKQIRAS